MKGAPDRLLPLCSSQLGVNGEAGQPLDPHFWRQAQEELSSQGLRVLALCRWAGGRCIQGKRSALGGVAPLPLSLFLWAA